MAPRTKTESHRQWKCPACGKGYKSPINIRGYVCANNKGHPAGKPKVDMKPEEV